MDTAGKLGYAAFFFRKLAAVFFKCRSITAPSLPLPVSEMCYCKTWPHGLFG